jgi:hypothetical protein
MMATSALRARASLRSGTAAVLALATCAAALAGCGGAAGGGRSQARAVALSYLRAASTNDGRGLCAVLSNAAQSEVEIGATCQQALSGGLAGFDGPKEHFEMRTLKLTLSGAAGHVSVRFTGLRQGVFRFVLIRQNGVWSVASALTWR